MACINMTLRGIPARIIHGNTLRGIVEHEWRNIHWFRVGEQDCETIKRFAHLTSSQPEPEIKAGPTETPPTGQDNHGQQEWVFGWL